MRFSVILLALGPLLAFAAPIAVPRDAGVELKREDGVVPPPWKHASDENGVETPPWKRDSEGDSVGSPPWKRDSEADSVVSPGWKRDDSSENGVSTPPWKRTKSKKRDDDSSNDSVNYSDW
ncbi:hypothetical protein RSAG8_04037, partial [Rhizoctonia solani AG-8 WAC10335]